MSVRFREIMKWMNELVNDHNRDERELFSIWQSLQTEINKMIDPKPPEPEEG